ncbi:vitronectin b [Stigmatopora argus]
METLRISIIAMLMMTTMDAISAADETCAGRCNSFNPLRKCQCDSMCVYYGSCCHDFDKQCPKKARGDTFEEEEHLPTTTTSLLGVLTPTTEPTTVLSITKEPPLPTAFVPMAPPADRDAANCSGRPFDAFLQLKNGSVYAFRGEYFFELDDTSVLPGYPKRIQDVWGIPGPVDAAFTRINCQGKSYIFKGRKYWRFDGDVLDEGFPRDITEGFDGVPNDLDAAFAVPAANHLQKEKAYFFKGDVYHVYEFVLQPSHQECVQMSRSSPSLLFSRYTDLFCDQTLEDLFAELFGTAGQTSSSGPHFIAKNWPGLTPPVDAAMVGRVSVSPGRPQSPRKPSSRRRRPSRKNRHGKSRQARFDAWIDLFNDDEGSPEVATAAPVPVATPVQYVYFFKRDQYYRADLRSKRVVAALPPYPRSIAKFWLGCKQEDAPDTTRAEKR